MDGGAKGKGFDRLLIVLIGAMLAYSFLFSWISLSKFESFDSATPQDMAAHNQAIWNTAHGQFLQQTVLYIGGLNHFYPLLALFAPIYWFGNHIFPLLFLYSLILASGALAVYLLAQDLLGSRSWGLLMGFCYLVYPGLHNLNLTDLKPIVLTAPFILFSLYFWQARRLWGFAIFALLASMATEQIAPLIIMFAPLAWIRRRDPRWILTPLLIGLATLFFSIYVYVPWASGAPYKHIRDHKLLSRLDLFSWGSYQKIFSFLGLALIPLFLSWEAFILAIPYLAFGPLATRIYTHYYFPLVAILFISLSYGLRRVQGWRPWKSCALPPATMILATGLILLLFFAFDPFLTRPRYLYPKSPSDHEAWALIRQIPEGASVTTDPCLLPALSLREELHEFSRKEYHGQEINYLDVDYILIDPRGPHRENPHHHRDYTGNSRLLMNESLRDRSGFEILAVQGNWVLFHRKSRP